MEHLQPIVKRHIHSQFFLKKLQKTFLKYTGEIISVNLIRASKSTLLDNQVISLGERKQIAQQMGDSLSNNMQFSKNMGVQRLNKNPVNEPSTVEKPELKRSVRIKKLK